MPTDKENVSFLYSMIRQLETKHINWKTVAFENDVSNDHAARMRFHRLRLFHDKITPGTRKSGAKGKGKGGKGKGDKRMFGDLSDDEEEHRHGKKKLKYDSDEDDDLIRHRRSTRIKREPKKSVKDEIKEDPAASAIKAEELLRSPVPTPMAFYAEVKSEVLPMEHDTGIENEMERLLIKLEQKPVPDASEAGTEAAAVGIESGFVEDSSATVNRDSPAAIPSVNAENDCVKESTRTGEALVSSIGPTNIEDEVEQPSSSVPPVASTAVQLGRESGSLPEESSNALVMNISINSPSTSRQASSPGGSIHLVQMEMPHAMPSLS